MKDRPFDKSRPPSWRTLFARIFGDRTSYTTQDGVVVRGYLWRGTFYVTTYELEG